MNIGTNLQLLKAPVHTILRKKTPVLFYVELLNQLYSSEPTSFVLGYK